jgi:integrase
MQFDRGAPVSCTRLSVPDRLVALGIAQFDSADTQVELRDASNGRSAGARFLATQVFPATDGGCLPRPKSSGWWFAAAVRRAEIQTITRHDLRHT